MTYGYRDIAGKSNSGLYEPGKAFTSTAEGSAINLAGDVNVLSHTVS